MKRFAQWCAVNFFRCKMRLGSIKVGTYCYVATGFTFSDTVLKMIDCIDGFSGLLLWMEAYHTNKDPKVIADYFMKTVMCVGGCPQHHRHLLTFTFQTLHTPINLILVCQNNSVSFNYCSITTLTLKK